MSDANVAQDDADGKGLVARIVELREAVKQLDWQVRVLRVAHLQGIGIERARRAAVVAYQRADAALKQLEVR